MVVIHVREQVHRISVILNGGITDNTESVKLMAQRTFANHELRCIGAIQTINTVRPAYTVLDSRRMRFSMTILEKSGCQHHSFSDGFQFLDDILITTLRGSAHIPSNVPDLFVVGKEL